jgi:hypothetical protein
MCPYFAKSFGGTYGLSQVEYWKCDSCGFVISKTHYDMTEEDWESLNQRYHSSYQGSSLNHDDPRWVDRLSAQADIISKLTNLGVIPRGSDDYPWIDYGCGDGKLAEYLFQKGLRTNKFDRYTAHSNSEDLDDLHTSKRKHSLVLNTSVFEHVRGIATLWEIVDLVADSGVMAVHTLVRETIPQDPSWFYLLPVHCSFYTNRSMQILFDTWRFESSIYHVESRMWFWFRGNEDLIKDIVKKEGGSLGEIYYKNGFMDYWK